MGMIYAFARIKGINILYSKSLRKFFSATSLLTRYSSSFRSVMSSNIQMEKRGGL